MKSKIVTLFSLGMLLLSACGEEDKQQLSETQAYADAAETDDMTENTDAAETNDMAEHTADYVGSWKLDYEKTEEHLQQHDSLLELFGTGLGTYGSDMTMQEDGSFSYYIGIGGSAEGQYVADGQTITAQVVMTYEIEEAEEMTIVLTVEQEGDRQYLLMEYDDEVLYWSEKQEE